MKYLIFVGILLTGLIYGVVSSNSISATPAMTLFATSSLSFITGLSTQSTHTSKSNTKRITAKPTEAEFYVTHCQCPNYCKLNQTGIGVADDVKFNSTQSVLFWSTLVTLFNPSVICVQVNETCGNKNYPTTSACLIGFGLYQPTPSCSKQVRLRISEVPVCQAVNSTVIKVGRKSSVLRGITIDMSSSISSGVLAGGILIACFITSFIILIIRATLSSQPNITIKIPKASVY
ncbi:minor M protein [Morelia viridis nidovirus]|uniref:Minor M protein n=1 Tax=Morelia viridis nidovirus TaxID=2016400 RepID=A0A222AIE5_9NIDO|nr:minor M protein [Morelia viridis nidovirus]ASO76152.1 minor M protein [Morelia viridis nidovirus]